MSRRAVAAVAAAAALLGTAGCTADPVSPAPSGSAASSPTTDASPGPGAEGVPDPAADDALSTPVEDSVYPEVGDPSVDALHYSLTLDWDRDRRHLTAEESIELRATTTAGSFQLDFGEPLQVDSATLDGRPVEVEHRGKDLVVRSPVEADRTYTLALAYSGGPEPVPAPTTRSDFSTTGWTVTRDGEVWTMQEPYGGYSWYAVNDHPSDKATYDFTLRVDAPWVGVANGTLTSRLVREGRTETRFEMAAPAASYLVTVAFADYAVRRDRTDDGLPLAYWVPRPATDRPAGQRALRRAFRDLRYTKPALAWLEGKLGPYPFDSAGILLTDSRSGMETQTLVTLGDTPYARSREVVVHEMAHQWYGDLVTPTDWRDLWMNEGMAMYLQLVYRSEVEGADLEDTMREVADYDASARAEAGPPGDYDPEAFGEGNVYYCPALMWHELRQRVGDEEFWRLVREWPLQHAYGNATRDQWFDWIEAETGLELTSFFDAWLMGARTPAT